MTKAFQTHQSQFGILIPVYPDSIQCRSAPISFLHLEWAQSSDSELISDVSRCLGHTKNVQDAHAREKKTREVQDNWRSVSNKSDPTHQLQWPRQSWNRLKTVHGLLVSRMFFNHYFCSPSLTIAKGYHKKKTAMIPMRRTVIPLLKKGGWLHWAINSMRSHHLKLHL